MKHSFLFLLTCAALAATPVAQSAAFTIVGTPCSVKQGTPTMGNTGLPVLGQSFSVDYSGPNTAGGTYTYQPHLVIGLNANPIIVPQSLFPAQPANCTLYETFDIVIPMALSPVVRPAYNSSYTLKVPNMPVLLGGTFWVQWFTVYTQCGIVPPCDVPWVVTSEAGLAQVGT